MTWELVVRYEDERTLSTVYTDVRLAKYEFAAAISNDKILSAVIITHGGLMYGDSVFMGYSEEWDEEFMTIPEWADI